MADFEIIEDVAKAVPKGKDLKKFTPFIIGGLGLGVVALLFSRRSPSSSPTPPDGYDGVGESPDLGGIMTDFTNQTNQAIQQNNQEMAYQLSEVAGNLFGVIGEQNQVINQLQKDLQSQLNQGGSVQYVPVYQQSTAIQEASTIYQSAGSSIYFDGVDDDLQYNTISKNINQAVKSGQITSNQAIQEKKTVAGIGNDGIGWTAEGWKDTQKRLDTDQSFKQSEIERAQLVIENRKQAGLSTASQEKYLSTLVK